MVISPDIRVDNSGRIETAMLIVVSDLEKIIKFDMKDDLIGNTILLDEENQVLYDPAGKADIIKDIADINYFLNGLCQRTGRFLADAGSRNYCNYDTNSTDLHILPEIHTGRCGCRCGKRLNKRCKVIRFLMVLHLFYVYFSKV